MNNLRPNGLTGLMAAGCLLAGCLCGCEDSRDTSSDLGTITTMVTSKPPMRPIADPATMPVKLPEVFQACFVPGVNALSKPRIVLLRGRER